MLHTRLLAPRCRPHFPHSRGLLVLVYSPIFVLVYCSAVHPSDSYGPIPETFLSLIIADSGSSRDRARQCIEIRALAAFSSTIVARE